VRRVGHGRDGAWSPLGAGVGWHVRALAVLPNGDLVAAGNFLAAGGAPANFVARWDGSSWSPLGSGTNHIVFALAVLGNGDLVAGGWFTTAGGVPANYVARWDGAAWHPLGSGLVPAALGAQGTRAFALLPGGDLVVGGQFAVAGGTPADRIARWNGTSWSAICGGFPGLGTAVLALAVMPDGGIVAGGELPSNGIARWHGGAWSPIGAGVALPGSVGRVYALASTPAGSIDVGGFFVLADDQVSPYVARLTTTCPASATSSGAGCAGSAGPLVLVATDLPWLGGTFRAHGTGLPYRGDELERPRTRRRLVLKSRWRLTAAAARAGQAVACRSRVVLSSRTTCSPPRAAR
jgi:hypothetical protein